MSEELETRIEYGHMHPGLGWIVEPRGIKYATHQRVVHFRVDEPVGIDHWTFADHRHPVEGCTFCADLAAQGLQAVTTQAKAAAVLGRRCYQCGLGESAHSPTRNGGNLTGHKFIDPKNVCGHTDAEGCTGHGDF